MKPKGAQKKDDQTRSNKTKKKEEKIPRLPPQGCRASFLLSLDLKSGALKEEKSRSIKIRNIHIKGFNEYTPLT